MRSSQNNQVGSPRRRAPFLTAWALPLILGVACGQPANLSNNNAADTGDNGYGHNNNQNLCPATLDVTRSVAINDLPVLESLQKNGQPRFSLQRVLQQIADTGNLNPQMGAADVYQRIFDTNNTAATGLVSGGQHCDDQKDANGNPVINGAPIECPRQEGILADLTQNNPFCTGPGCTPYSPIAITNRFDLAPPSGENCGQYRIVFGKGQSGVTPLASAGVTDGKNRNLIIFEAIMPNPTPGCGISSCAPVVEFWAKLSNVSDPNLRAALLDQFFFQGIGNFPPAVAWDHYTGFVNPQTGVQDSGQIRANQFMNDNVQVLPGATTPVTGQGWQLREYNLASNCVGGRDPKNWFNPCKGQVDLVSVKINPNASLFADAETITDPNLQQLATKFQDPSNATGFLSQVQSLSSTEVNLIAMGGLDRAFNGGQSSEQPDVTSFSISGGQDSDYIGTFNPAGTFATAIQAALTSQNSSLSPADIVARAETQACAGCHETSTSVEKFALGTTDVLGGICPDSFNTSAPSCVWPDTNGFTQTSEKVLSPLTASTATCNAACTASPTTCQCSWLLSPALTQVFMPFRAQNMQNFLTKNVCGSGRCGTPGERLTLTHGDRNE